MFGTPMDEATWFYGVLPSTWAAWGCIGTFPDGNSNPLSSIKYDAVVVNAPFYKQFWDRVAASTVWSELRKGVPLIVIVHGPTQRDDFWNKLDAGGGACR